TSRIAAVEQSVACRRRLAGMVVAYTVPTASNSNISADDPSFPPRFAMNTPVRTRLAFSLRWLAGIRRLEAAVFVLGLAVLGTAGPTIHGRQSAGSVVALVGGTVYPSPDEAPIADGVVVIDGPTVSAVGTRRSVPIPSGASTIDCRGLFIVAGFQNSHVHFTEPKWIDASSQPAPKLSSELDAMLTRYGFTTVVD